MCLLRLSQGAASFLGGSAQQPWLGSVLVSDFHQGPARPGRLLLLLGAFFCAAIIIPWGAARVLSTTSPEAGLTDATVGDATGTWSLPLQRPDGTPVRCTHTQGNSAESKAWACSGVEIASMVAERPENADRTLRRAMRAVTSVAVTQENARVVTQDIGERGEVASASMALVGPGGKTQPAPVVAFQLRPQDGEHKGKVLTVVVHKAQDEQKVRDAAGAVWHTLSGTQPEGEMIQQVEVASA